MAVVGCTLPQKNIISEKRKKQKSTNLSGCYLMPTYPIS